MGTSAVFACMATSESHTGLRSSALELLELCAWPPSIRNGLPLTSSWYFDPVWTICGIGVCAGSRSAKRTAAARNESFRIFIWWWTPRGEPVPGPLLAAMQLRLAPPLAMGRPELQKGARTSNTHEIGKFILLFSCVAKLGGDRDGPLTVRGYLVNAFNRTHYPNSF